MGYVTGENRIYWGKGMLQDKNPDFGRDKNREKIMDLCAHSCLCNCTAPEQGQSGKIFSAMKKHFFHFKSINRVAILR
jgi:hypothetical protein